MIDFHLHIVFIFWKESDSVTSFFLLEAFWTQVYRIKFCVEWYRSNVSVLNIKNNRAILVSEDVKVLFSLLRLRKIQSLNI